MQNWLSRQAQKQPEKVALVCGDLALSYRELADRAARWAALFRAHVGDDESGRIALCGSNRVEWIVAAHGAWWAGATVVGLHHRASKSELSFQLDRVEPSLVIGTPQTNDSSWPVISWDQARQRADQMETDLEAQPLDEDDVLTILFTSGSSGRPKAVPSTVANHLASGYGTADRLDVGTGDRWLCCLPLCHIGGLAIAIRSAIYGATVELVPDFDADEILELLQARPVTVASFVPTMLIRILERAPKKLHHHLRCVLIGGGAISAGLLRRARGATLPVVPTYGMTEATSQITTLSPAAPQRFFHTAGRPLPGLEIEIRDEHGAPLEAGEVGAIFVRGATISPGYLDATKRTHDARWFNTGDWGHLDDNGRLVIDPQRGERIISGGENIDPRQVEAALLSCDEVADAAVVGVDDAVWGQVVGAVVVAAGEKKPEHTDVDKLDRTCRRALAPYKVPRRWAFISRIPRTISEKTKRDEIREYLVHHGFSRDSSSKP